MTKRILTVLLAVAMVASMSGCKKDAKNKGEIKLGEYMGLDVYEAEAEVTDDDWNSTLEGIISNNTTEESVTEGEVAEGDAINISYVGKLPDMDNFEFSGGTASDYQLYVGQSGFIDGFDDGLVGRNVGDTFDLNLKFPDDYENKTEDADGNELVLAGKNVVFTVTINSKTIKNTPEFTDEFVQNTYGYYDVSTTAELEEYVRGELRKYNIFDAIWETIVENSEVVKYDEDEVADEVDYYNNYYEQQYMSNYGVDLETYLEAVGYEKEQWDSDVLEYAQGTVKEKMIVRAIADENDLNPTDKEYKKQATIYMNEYGYDSIEALEEAVGVDNVEYAVMYVKVQDFLCENVKMNEGERPTEAESETETSEIIADEEESSAEEKSEE